MRQRVASVKVLAAAAVFTLTACRSENGTAGKDEEAPAIEVNRTKRAERSYVGSTTRDRLKADWKAAQALPDNDERVAALIKVFQEAIDPAPDIAEGILREIPADVDERFALVQRWVRHLVGENRIKDAKAWAESIYSEDQRRLIRSEIAATLMQSNPGEAIQMLSSDELEAGGADSASGTVLQMWTSKEPEKAVTWASRLPDGQAREAGFQSVFSAWAGTNGGDALSWIGTQTNPHVRRDALDGAARAFQHHPEPIFESIFSEADPELKQELQQRIAELNAAETVPAEEE